MQLMGHDNERDFFPRNCASSGCAVPHHHTSIFRGGQYTMVRVGVAERGNPVRGVLIGYNVCHRDR